MGGVLTIAHFAHFLYEKKMRFFAQIMKDINRIVFACDIPYQVDIPTSCHFAHQGLGVVIHPLSSIGQNCSIYQNVTIGQNEGDGKGCKAPKIGNNVIVAANSVVLRSIPDNAVVAGVPAAIKKFREVQNVFGDN